MRPAARTWVLLGLGLAGTASIALLPLERLVPAPLPVWQLRLLALIQPALLTVVAVLVGAACAPRVGLGTPLIDAWLARGDARAALRRQLPAAAIVGVAVALLLVAVGAMMPDRLGGPFSAPLATRLLYGGLTEELLTRWGLVSLFAWIAWATGGRPPVPGRAAMWVAITLAALLFAVGHLPMLALLAPDAPPALVATVVLGNALPGIAFGWLYWRRGLEAAMMAHALAHLLSWPLLA